MIGDSGYLRIEGKDDRVLVASILYKNGYTVQKVRRKKNQKTYEYLVKYDTNSEEVQETE